MIDGVSRPTCAMSRNKIRLTTCRAEIRRALNENAVKELAEKGMAPDEELEISDRTDAVTNTVGG